MSVVRKTTTRRRIVMSTGSSPRGIHVSWAGRPVSAVKPGGWWNRESCRGLALPMSHWLTTCRGAVALGVFVLLLPRTSPGRHSGNRDVTPNGRLTRRTGRAAGRHPTATASRAPPATIAASTALRARSAVTAPAATTCRTRTPPTSQPRTGSRFGSPLFPTRLRRSTNRSATSATTSA